MKLPLKFYDIKPQLIDKINKISDLLNIDESLTLLDGFTTIPFQHTLTEEIFMEGTTIPMIVLMGNETGRIYFFALKKLLKELP